MAAVVKEDEKAKALEVIRTQILELKGTKELFTTTVPTVVQMPPEKGKGWEQTDLGRVHLIINAYVDLGVLNKEWRINSNKIGKEFDDKGNSNGTEKAVEALQRALGVAFKKDNRGQFDKLTLDAIQRDLEKREKKQKESVSESRVPTKNRGEEIANAIRSRIDPAFREFDEKLKQLVNDKKYVEAARIYEQLGNEDAVVDLVTALIKENKLDDAKTIAKLLKEIKSKNDAAVLIASVEKTKKSEKDLKDEFSGEYEEEDPRTKAEKLVADKKYYEAAKIYNTDLKDKIYARNLAIAAEKNGNVHDARQIYEMLKDNKNAKRLEKLERLAEADKLAATNEKEAVKQYLAIGSLDRILALAKNAENANRLEDAENLYRTAKDTRDAIRIRALIEADQAELLQEAREKVRVFGKIIDDLIVIRGYATVNISGQKLPVYADERRYFENSILGPLKEEYILANSALKTNSLQKAIQLSKDYAENAETIKILATGILTAKTALNEKWSDYSKRKQDYDAAIEKGRTDLAKYGTYLETRRKELSDLNRSLNDAVNTFQNKDYTSISIFNGVVEETSKLVKLDELPAEIIKPKISLPQIKIVMGHGEESGTPLAPQRTYEVKILDGDKVSPLDQYADKYRKMHAPDSEIPIEFHFIEYHLDTIELGGTPIEGIECISNPDPTQRAEKPYVAFVDRARHAIYELETYTKKVKSGEPEIHFKIKRDSQGNPLKIADLDPKTIEGVPELTKDSQNNPDVIKQLAQTRKEPEIMYLSGAMIFAFATIRK